MLTIYIRGLPHAKNLVFYPTDFSRTNRKKRVLDSLFWDLNFCYQLNIMSYFFGSADVKNGIHFVYRDPGSIPEKKFWLDEQFLQKKTINVILKVIFFRVALLPYRSSLKY